MAKELRILRIGDKGASADVRNKRLYYVNEYLRSKLRVHMDPSKTIRYLIDMAYTRARSDVNRKPVKAVWEQIDDDEIV